MKCILTLPKQCFCCSRFDLKNKPCPCKAVSYPEAWRMLQNSNKACGSFKALPGTCETCNQKFECVTGNI